MLFASLQSSIVNRQYSIPTASPKFLYPLSSFKVPIWNLKFEITNCDFKSFGLHLQKPIYHFTLPPYADINLRSQIVTSNSLNDRREGDEYGKEKERDSC